MLPSYHARFRIHWNSKILLKWLKKKGNPSYKVIFFIAEGVALCERDYCTPISETNKQVEIFSKKVFFITIYMAT
jgi:hypothetical protein